MNEERFLTHVDRSGECWPWIGCRLPSGYGKLTIQAQGKQKTWTAHRYAYTLFIGPIPDGQIVMHRCDNPSCVNPAHLFSGTWRDNMTDMIGKGRDRFIFKREPLKASGENNSRTKHTAEQVIAMRKAFDAGSSLDALADEYGTTHSHVYHMVSGKTWKHLKYRISRPILHPPHSLETRAKLSAIQRARQASLRAPRG